MHQIFQKQSEEGCSFPCADSTLRWAVDQANLAHLLDNSLDILYQDDDLVVVNKPSGLLAAPGKVSPDSVVSRYLAMFPDAPSHPAVHRLDMDTSGIMILSRHPEAHKRLSRQFEQRSVKKHYIAELDGIVKGESGTIELPFRLDVDNRPHQIYDPVYGKMGTTHWVVISRTEATTRVRFTPVTGRTHQLRVHSAHEKGLGCPIIDDTLYGTGKEHGKLRLHATSITFQQPLSGETIHLESLPTF